VIICSETKEEPKKYAESGGGGRFNQDHRQVGKKKVGSKSIHDKVKNKIYFIMNAVATGALRERLSVVEMVKVRKSDR